MPEYAQAFTAERAFAASRTGLDVMISTLVSPDAAWWTADAAEGFIAEAGREVLRAAMQGWLDTRAAAELADKDAGRITTPTDAAGVRHGAVEPGHVRRLATVFGTVTVTRCAFRARGRANLYLLDAALNLPARLHSAGVSRLAVAEAVRDSFAGADAAITAFCGPVAGNRQVQQMVGEGAADVEAFYAARVPVVCGDEVLLVLTVDAKGIVMRPADLREATRKEAEAKGPNAMHSRLAAGEKHGRKRMATLGAVYDAIPAPRRPHDVITLAEAGKKKTDKKPQDENGKNRDTDKKENKKENAAKATGRPNGKGKGKGKRPGPKAQRKWLTGSVERTAAEVISQVFAQALARDPDQRRTWIVLVDGANAQIDAIKKEAAKHHLSVNIVVDLIHVIEHLWDAAWCLHAKGDTTAETWVAAHALTILGGGVTAVASALTTTVATPGLSAEKRKTLTAVAGYLTNKTDYLHYDQALKAGWPIATGVIEGACRHLIGDRLDISGARWSLTGAEAVLNLRALISNGDLNEYWAFHLHREHQRNHQSHYQQDFNLAA